MKKRYLIFLMIIFSFVSCSDYLNSTFGSDEIEGHYEDEYGKFDVVYNVKKHQLNITGSGDLDLDGLRGKKDGKLKGLNWPCIPKLIEIKNAESCTIVLKTLEKDFKFLREVRLEGDVTYDASVLDEVTDMDIRFIVNGVDLTPRSNPSGNPPTMIYSAGDYSYSGNDSLQFIYLSGGFNIGNYAFQNCSILYQIQIQSFAGIGAGAFQNCTRLKEIYIDQISTQGSYSRTNNAFEGSTNSPITYH